MARYYFHVRNGDVLVKDSEGTEIPEAETLEEEAIEAARDLLAEGDLQGLDRSDWVYEVADEIGATVLTLKLKDAVEPDTLEDRDIVEDAASPVRWKEEQL